MNADELQLGGACADDEVDVGQSDACQEYAYRHSVASLVGGVLMGVCLVFLGMEQVIGPPFAADAAPALHVICRMLGLLMLLSGLLFYIPASLWAIVRQKAGKSRVVLSESSLTVPIGYPVPVDDYVRLDEIQRICVMGEGRQKRLVVHTRKPRLELAEHAFASQDQFDELAEALAESTGRTVEHDPPWQFTLGSLFWLMTMVAAMLGLWIWLGEMERPWRRFVPRTIMFVALEAPLGMWLWKGAVRRWRR